MTGLLRRVRGQEAGIVSLEAAIVLPFVLLIGAGTIEFGWLMTQIETAQGGLRDAARYVSRSPVTGTLQARICNEQVPGWPTAQAISDDIYAANGIDSATLEICVVPVGAADATLNRGMPIYRVEANTTFTPVGVGIMALFNISLPEISLNYELRHAGS